MPSIGACGKRSVLALPPSRKLIFMVPKINEKVQIVVDDRERPSGVIEELEKALDVVVKIEHLPLGDYCVDGAVLIERKTAADFAQSLIDGRLFGQAGRMSSSAWHPLILLRGQVRNGLHSASRERRCKALW